VEQKKAYNFPVEVLIDVEREMEMFDAMALKGRDEALK